ncbi:protein phosphatase 2C domain-containing protein [Amycolatopsis taiwanensis]|uniref:protein phosphatase 2C domain-containing protein n=1 Tax=Amycolatopsis taiwanensis TaxID=342230 RepID=UPI0004835C94|nr:protein phosphatase 2C domain-containing protein [Amycolatopsis taiwanensis]
MPEIHVAERAGVGPDGKPRPSEDHVVVLENAALVLDGATSSRLDLPSGGWYAGHLAERLAARLHESPGADLAAVLAGAIAEVAAKHDLKPGAAPSSTVAMLRWTADRVDGLVLADSPIVAFGQSGPSVLADDRLATLRRKGRLSSEARVRALRNTEDGFWVAEADPTAARHAVRRSWPRNEVDTVLLATDGVAVAVDDYRILDWSQLLEIGRTQGLSAVLDTVRAAEAGDPGCLRWPRAKPHDDQALIMVDFR